jgi:monoamine oxidase
MTKEVDVVIVGGGAAGIGAARRLAGTGLSTLMLEAASRLGGRAWTCDIAGFPLDLGCGWLHSANRNAWTRIAEASRFTVDRHEAAWGEQYADLGIEPAEQKAAKKALANWNERLPPLLAGSDCAGDALVPGCKWNPYVRAICGFANGVAPEDMSVSDYLAYDEATTGRNWRVPAGYGTLIAASLPQDTTLRLATPVQAIAEDRRRLVVTTAAGNISARAVILTVSTAVLSGRAITLPASLDPWRDAALQLPLGRDEKLYLQIIGDTPFVPETHLFGDFYDSRTCAFYIRPFGWPIIECFLGGDSARVVEKSGIAAGFALAVEQLANLVGSGIHSKLRPLAGSSWSLSDHIGGAYSCALPGHAHARYLLAQPYDERIFFAGEATSTHDFSTAHGAHDSGVRGAEEVIATLAGQNLRAICQSHPEDARP